MIRQLSTLCSTLALATFTALAIAPAATATTPYYPPQAASQSFVITNLNSDQSLCTAVNSKDPRAKTNRLPIIQYPYYGDATQRWRLEPQAGGLYRIVNVYTGKVLCTSKWSRDPDAPSAQQ